MLNPLRWTGFVYLFPERYLDPSVVDLVEIEWFERQYHWDEDPYNGLLDWAQTPRQTIARGHGDCEDFALLAASWLRGNDIGPIELAFCRTDDEWTPSHVLCAGPDRVFSSGTITETSLADWMNDSKYTHSRVRTLD